MLYLLKVCKNQQLHLNFWPKKKKNIQFLIKIKLKII